MRISDVLRIKTYIDRFSSDPMPSALPFPLSPATVTQTRLTPFIEMQETMLLGLRLTQEGVSAETFRQRFGQDLMVVFGREINELIQLGLLEWTPSPTGGGAGVRVGARLRLTRRGRLLGNQVFMRFVD
jgi:oxygen-independent coproporphyrinogen-3 oxidase